MSAKKPQSQPEQTPAISTKAVPAKKTIAKKGWKTPAITPEIRTAYAKWLRGVGRGELVKTLSVKMTYGALGRAFRAMHPDKTWKELKAMRRASKAPMTQAKQGATRITRVRKVSKTAGAGQQKAA